MLPIDPDSAIIVSSVTKRYGSLSALDSFDLEVKKGEIFALLGPNGAGKTTLIRILTTLMSPTSGEAFVYGMNTSRNGREIRRLIGEPQENSLDRYLSVSEIVIAKIFSGFSHGLIKGMVVALVIFTITPFRFPLTSLAAYLAFLIPGSVLFSCAGVISGTLLEKPETIGRVEAVLIMPLIFMSGLFFPMSSYPPAVAPFINLLPTTALFEGARQAMVTGNFSIVYSMNLWLCALISFLAAVLIFRKNLPSSPE